MPLSDLNFVGYSPVGDIVVMMIVSIFLILIRAAYIKPTREFRVFKCILFVLVLAAKTDILYHIFDYFIGQYPNIFIYLFRYLYHSFLFLDLVLYTVYLEYTMQLNGRGERIYSKIAFLGFAVFSVLDLVLTFVGVGFHITKDNTAVTGANFFPVEYLFFVLLLLFSMMRYKQRIYRPIIWAFVATIFFALLAMYIQGIHHQQSFTTVTFVFPAVAVLYLLHANPYDPEMGTLRTDSFEAALHNAKNTRTRLIIMSLFMHEFEQSGRKYPKEIRDTIRSYSENFFKNTTVFQISSGRMILVADVASNPDYAEETTKMLGIFKEHYQIYRQDYKIVIMQNYDALSEPDDYISFIQYIEGRMFENEISYVDEKSLDKFFSHKYIVDELADISEKHDLYDDRVVVYCQPVYNLQTGKFDTAEALMRLRLEKTGMVYPDRFIPIAETHNYVHMLSIIILAKTCRQIKKLMDEGYDVKRISVNFSIMDVREKTFEDSVKGIIEESGIPYDKIAIEITESQNEKDFSIVKEKITELKQSGITFYLDDFGTGYSSFERIMQLPFDIIKFDRSLVIASNTSTKSKTMVSYMAHMFTDMNYSVLFEGVEDEKDEERCIGMYARYLQGYKYSKPIPIEELTNYFVKA